VFFTVDTPILCIVLLLRAFRGLVSSSYTKATSFYTVTVFSNMSIQVALIALGDLASSIEQFYIKQPLLVVEPIINKVICLL
jgi:hypothetical protein